MLEPEPNSVMIKNILIDSNKTLEDAQTYALARPAIFTQMARRIADQCGRCTADLLHRFHSDSCERFGVLPWEHHPVFWRTVLADCLAPADVQRVLQDIYSQYLDLYGSTITLYADVLPFLSEQVCDRALALVANANSLRMSRLIARYELHQYFRVIAISGESPYQKPQPFLFRYALNQLGANAQDSVMIGDRLDNDIGAAATLGLRTIHLWRDGAANECLGSPWHCPDAQITTLSQAGALLRHPPAIPISVIPEEFQADSLILRDAVVMCGGRGARMEKLTESQQKCVLPLGGTPILEYIVRTLAAMGCSHVCFVVGYRADDVVELVGDGSRYGIEAEYVDGGSGSTLSAVRSCLTRMGDAFYYLHGNIVYPARLLQRLWWRFCREQCDTIVVVPSEDNIGHARVRVGNDGWATGIDCVERRMNHGMLFSGIGIYRKSSFASLSPGQPAGMTESVLVEVLAQGGRVAVVTHPGEWRHYESQSEYLADRNDSVTDLVRW